MGKKLSGSITLPEEQELEGLFQIYPDIWYTYEVLNGLEEKENIPQEFLKEIQTLLQQDEQPAHARENKIIPLKPVYGKWIKAGMAALVIIAFSWGIIGGYQYFNNPAKTISKNNEIVVLNGTKTDVTLPDGSRIILNSGSKLTYPKNYAMSDVREVWLSGEAYFKIRHDKKHPFIIHTAGFNVRDIGTTFNVKAYPGETNVASLIEGAIEISFKNNTNKKILLKPHQKLILVNKPANKADKAAIHPIIRPDNYKILPLEVDEKNKSEFIETAWVDNQLIFKDEPFETLAKKMERRYNIQITFGDDRIKLSHLTGSFKNENIKQAFVELQQTTPFKYKIDHDKIFIQSLDN